LAAEEPKLRRELRFAGTASVSVGRDGLATRRLGGVSAATGVPRRALAVGMGTGLVLLTAFRLAGTPALDVFFYLATIGVLSLLVMYLLTNVAAARHLGRRAPGQLVAPAAGVLVAGFVLYHNVWPVPPAPYEFFPWLVLAWLAAGVVIITCFWPEGSSIGSRSLRRGRGGRRRLARGPAGGRSPSGWPG